MARNLAHDSSAFVIKESKKMEGMETHIENENSSGEAVVLPEKYTNFTEGSSQFNIQGNYIGQAAIGNTGTVTFNQSTKTYDRGARHDTYEIKGGNFPQATIGGVSKYNNDGSSVAGGGGGITSPEQITLHILEKGVTCDQFIDLLEKNYTLARIACSVPNNPYLKDRMINALLLN